MACNPAGMAGTMLRGGGTGSCTCLYAIDTGESPVKGGRPVIIS